MFTQNPYIYTIRELRAVVSLFAATARVVLISKYLYQTLEQKQTYY